MGGGGPQVPYGNQSGFSQSNINMNPQYSRALSSGANQFQGQTQNFQNDVNNAVGKFNTNFSNYTPQLNTNFAPTNFPTTLDAFSKNLVSQGQGQLASQTAAQQANIANNFRGNPGAAQVLQSQAGMQGNLAQNPLMFQAAQQQQAREAQNYELNQRAQGLSNEALLQQGQANQNGLGLDNAALSQLLQIKNAGLDSQQNLLSVLGSLGALTGTATTNSSSVQSPFFGNYGSGAYMGQVTPSGGSRGSL